MLNQMHDSGYTVCALGREPSKEPYEQVSIQMFRDFREQNF